MNLKQQYLAITAGAARDPRVMAGASLAALLAVVAFFMLIGGDSGFVFERQPPGEPRTFTVTPDGDEVSRLSPIKVTFARPPAEREGESILTLEPAVPGEYVWLTERTLVFQPDYPGLLRGHEYTIRVPPQADAGHYRNFVRRFATGGVLEVVSVIPAPDDVEVPDGVQVLVQFSRSVAPLTLLSEQPEGAVLTFNPPLEGRGEWLNTALYRFVPASGAIQPNTTYEASVSAALTEEADGVLREDYVWRFQTYGPALVRVTPDRNTQYVGPRQTIEMEFNQPMDRASVEAGFLLRQVDGATQGGNFVWSDDSRAVSFQPWGGLALQTRFEVQVPQGLRGANGGQTATEQRIQFETVGRPSIVRTTPAQGSTSAERYGVHVEFSSPMDETSFEGRIAVSSLEPDDIRFGLNPNGLRLSINIPLEPSTAYTVTLAQGISDRYGQPLPPFTLRFTTGQRPPMVSYAIPNQVATYSAATEPVLYFHATNTPEVSFTLYPLTRAEMREIQQRNHVSPGRDPFMPSQPEIASWTETTRGPLNEVSIRSTSLSRTGNPLPKGDYLVRTSADWRSELAFSVVDTALVTKVSFNELLVWAIDLQSGEAVSGLTIAAVGSNLPVNARATTDAQGLASFTMSPPSRYDRDFDGVLETESDSRFGIASTRWQYGASTWDIGVPTELYPRTYVGHVYTERPIYRRGEEVFFKGVLRLDDDAVYTVPAETAGVALVIYDSQHEELTRIDVQTNEFGTFAGSFILPDEAATGDYGVQLTYVPENEPEHHRDHIAGTSFLVAEFRRPEFQVEAGTPQENYLSGETLQAEFEATFYFGGAVEGARADWTVLSYPASPEFEGYERFSFSDYDYYRQATTFEQPMRGRGSATTGRDGVARIDIPAVIEGNEGTRRYEVSAGVLDESGQVVGGSVSVLVHPAAAYAGIRPQEYVASAGKASLFDIASVDVEGRPLPNRAVTVNVYEREWVTTKEQTPGGARRYRSEPRDTMIATLDATTDAEGAATLSYTPDGAGTLRLVAEITDDLGRTARSATYLWVSSRHFASWRVSNDDTLELIADKERYEVGETARVIVPAPFEGAFGLVTVERGKIIEREVRAFPTNSELLEIPLNDIAVPNVFVGVVLYRPPTAEDPVPRYKVGYVKLDVSTDVRLLDVSIRPSVDQARPGETVRYDIEVKDRSGRGVRSELSVAVVDKAVLSLTHERGITGLRAFWFERGLGVVTASSLAVSVDRSNDVISEPPQGGKGGGGLDDPRLRQQFRNTAYWEAQVVTDDDGKASVEVEMPDNLTTWRMQVRALSGDILVGEATNELVSTQPLLLRPALPRFLRVGDSFAVRTLVRNATAETQEVLVSLEAEGITVESELEQTLAIAPNTSEEVSWPASVAGEGAARLTFTARGNGVEDAVVQTLPIYLDVTPETMATGGVVTDRPVTEAIFLPSYTIQGEGKGSLFVGVQASLTGSIADRIVDFGPYPWESTDLPASRLLATLAAVKAEPAATRPYSNTLLQGDMAGLVSAQNGDGGWPWCRACPGTSDPQVTGWILQALGAWQDAGNNVNSSTVDAAARYVYEIVHGFRDVEKPSDPNLKAYLLYSLAAAGREAEALSTMRAVLEQDRENLANWGRAYLLLGFARAGLDKGDPGVQTLLNDLAARVLPSANGNHWEDPRTGSLAQSGPRTTALVLQAMADVDPSHPLIEETARWLVVALNTNVCRTTIERAQAIVGLAAFAEQTGERGSSFEYAVRLDDAEILGGRLRSAGALELESIELPIGELRTGSATLLSLARDYSKKGRMYYTLNLRYVTPAREVEALNRGFAISRQYSLLDDPDTPVSSASVGDVVRVRLTVMLPTDRNYVVVEDFLPAGLDPIEPKLSIVEPALKAQLHGEMRAANRPDGLQYFAPWFRWYYNPWQQADILDDKVRLSATALQRGVYEFIYYARASTPGDYFVAPSHVEESYFPEVFGRSDSSRFTVQR